MFVFAFQGSGGEAVGGKGDGSDDDSGWDDDGSSVSSTTQHHSGDDGNDAEGGAAAEVRGSTAEQKQVRSTIQPQGQDEVAAAEVRQSSCTHYIQERK